MDAIIKTKPLSSCGPFINHVHREVWFFRRPKVTYQGIGFILYFILDTIRVHIAIFEWVYLYFSSNREIGPFKYGNVNSNGIKIKL